MYPSLRRLALSLLLAVPLGFVGIADAAVTAPGFLVSPVTALGNSVSSAAYDGSRYFYYATYSGFTGTSPVDIYRFDTLTNTETPWAAGANETTPGSYSGYANSLAYDRVNDVLYYLADTFPAGRIIRLEDANGSGAIDMVGERSVYYDLGSGALVGDSPAAIEVAPDGSKVYLTSNPPGPGVSVYWFEDVAPADGSADALNTAATSVLTNEYGSGDHIAFDPNDSAVLYVSGVEFDLSFNAINAPIVKLVDGNGDGDFADVGTDTTTTFLASGAIKNPQGVSVDGAGDVWVLSKPFGGDAVIYQYEDTDNDGISDVETFVADVTAENGSGPLDFAQPVGDFEPYGATGDALYLPYGVGFSSVVNPDYNATIQQDGAFVDAGSGTETFFPGDDFEVTLDFTSLEESIFVSIQTYTGRPPYASGDNVLNRWWVVTVVPEDAVFDATVTLNYAEADLGAADETAFDGAYRLQGAIWNKALNTSIDTTTNTVTIANVSAFSHWTVGAQSDFTEAIAVPTLTFWGIASLLSVLSFGLVRRRREVGSHE